ncbi:PGPGW domain-containing protein [Pedobacter sp.]|nr:PGPGW domain-containing protein [Candidatus Saccharibacteria bacterium]
MQFIFIYVITDVILIFMQSFKKMWFRLHRHVRQPIILTIGMFFVLASALTGWLPGPGGIPLFLIGITILATEFRWAERIRDRVLRHVHLLGHWLRLHPKLGAILITLGIICSITFIYAIYFH